ncbi:peptide chain release factor 1 [bacterium]|nr:MAG: peptide chain release factor 1 [bacterium]
MFTRLAGMESRLAEIDAELAEPGAAFDQGRLIALTKERATLEQPVEAYRRLEALSRQLADAHALTADTEMRELAQAEVQELEGRIAALHEELRLLLLPKDPYDEKSIFVEVRAGTGGEEAALFASELARMYMRYAESLNYRVELLSISEADAGGYKEAVFAVNGKGAYRHFKFESGVHRVQRVPATESQGRVHTSTATVAVMPEADEVDVEINSRDLQIDTYKSSGAGGQHVNKTESAIRITHVPTGIVVACQEERSQLQNRERAMGMLRAALLDRKIREQQEERSTLRRSQVGTGERSEKIRTYNFPQDRITDHRLNQNFGNIRGVMEGDMGKIVEQLWQHEQAELLAAGDHPAA